MVSLLQMVIRENQLIEVSIHMYSGEISGWIIILGHWGG